MWARCDGILDIHMFYRADPSYDLGAANNNVFEWLPKGHYNDFYGKAVDAWTWEINWPENVPTLKLGQTLTTAVNGLPEVWNAKSLALVYTNATAILFDPTVIQSTGPKDSEGRNAFTTTSEFVRFLGLTPGEDGITYKGGRYTFGKAPASVADRFYIDTSAEIASCVRLRGEMEEKNAGTKMLHLNLLNQQERSELAAMLDDKGKTIAEVWSSLFTTPTDNALFAQEAVEPSLTTTNQTASVVSPSTPYQVEWQTTYKPVDHYALTAKGIGPNQNGYLTLLENDNPDTAIVAEGDPISMHIIKVVPELYTGSLIVREDPTNLLSQQLSVLYTEGFAGDAGNYTFEWKWAEPTATGRVPENYENGYMLHAKADGLTRFLIGAQGDTLENMVNRYYVMRYRPKAGSTELDALKAAIKARDKDTADLSDNDPRLWSDWCGPTLAEGWIQRVLNNVTPFTQRMTDLYTNPTETAVSMIQQAGAPYTGDVALNQDNLTNVGLIQLYATLLNKAESMSINQTTGSGAVNDQLLLAATRLADLYCVLGDEAYVDALNPTIGFGSEFARVDDANIGIDYGALSTGLFCFDNQVQSLLDEELALLRGRAAEDAPSKQTGPWYNRLLWNFTKGITAGEVAYAVNYNITGSTTGILDEETAAKLYPQGHGDAYGHYLSAVKAYYRLLRNPNFSWGTPGMGEMLMADAVVNNDYYEENRFSELAGALAKTAAAIMERTAQKAWRDNGGLPGAGYLDEDASRAFGYGEWGTRGALGAFYGWAVGNSLLPAGPTQDHLWQFRAIRQEDALMPPTIVAELPQDCSTSATFKPDGDTGETLLQPFTFELQIEVTEAQPALTGENTAPPLLFLGSQSESSAADGLTIFRDANGLLTATHGKGLTTLGTLPPNERCLLAIRRSVTLLDANLKTYDQQLTVTLLNANGMPYWETVLPETASEKQPLFEFNGKLLLGCGIEGTFHEIRWWQGIARSNEALVAARQKLISESTALKFAVHTYADAATDTLRDTVSSNACQVIGGTWEKIASNGLATDFRDDGLLRINRSTADDLNDLPQQLKSITDSLDRLDVGVSPLGLVHNAMPFDLSPIGLEDGTQTHFEQILSRAETAVANAATILDHVQQLGNRLRQIQEAQTAYEEQLESQEASLTADLIGYYGTPYSGDIGAGKFYTQDYAGPDLYHYMYMDLTAYGLTEVPSSSNAKVTRAYQIAEEDYRYVGDYGKNSSLQVEKKGTLSLSYDLTADGFIAKPEDLTGSRRTTGAIQQAYADVLTAYVAYDNLLKLATQQEKLMEDIITEMQAVYRSSVQFYQFKAICETVLNTIQAGNAIGAAVTNALGVTYEITNTFANASAESASTWVVAGLAAGTNASETIAKFVAAGVVIPSEITSKVANAEFATANAIVKAVDQFIRAETALFGNEVNLRASLFNYRSALRTQLGTYVGTINSLHSAAALLQAKIQQMTQTIYEAEGIQSVRNRVRRQAADGIARMRYNDMFFRQLRNEALARYEKAFALAQRYTYLAAQAYDYETCQLTAGLAGDDFRGEIVAARSLGVLTADRKPMLAGSYGDPGLSDILARLKADYLVLKPRLGINNPKQEMTWFSLRRELLRFGSDSEGDRAWQAALERYTVKDLRAHAEFMRYCRPLTSSTGTTLAEPGLVIPFETSIDFARNFFGKDLQGGDSAFSPTDFATRIAGAGVALEGYNVPASGVVGTPPLAATPQVYLVPAGDDYFRTPGDADTILRYSVVDQTVPLPYNVGQSQLDDPDWQPLYDGNTGGVDLGARLRKYGSFRASVGTDTAETGSTRLIGRSVWNSRWLLIIPFGSMHTDRDAAMRAFIYGTTAYPGVNDIRLGLRTYSHEGN
ncbi:MAG: hypothetical protein IJV69_02180 [Kiritimatiellae bacterium]|nr:hypothetical protein [Kiritimatiellia bacterium]